MATRECDVMRRGRKFADPADEPLTPTPLTTAGPQPWHKEALRLRYEEGHTVRTCARYVGVSFGRMQRFLNPESKAKAKARAIVWERERRHADPQYAKKVRSYVRRYMQIRAPERWKD